MAVSHIATGTVANASSTTLTIAAPSGLAGDLLVFILMHDDASDSASGMSATSAPVAVTSLFQGGGSLGTPSGGAGQIDDSKCYVWYCVHDQDAGENWTFGTLGAAEELRGVCLRFRGQNATPILAGSLVTDLPRTLTFFPPSTAVEWGSMFVGVRWDDAAPGAQTPPTGWDERVDSSVANNSLYVATSPAINYPFPSTFTRTNAASGDEMGSLSFVISPASSTTYDIEGVTRDKDGEILVSCEVSLYRERSANNYEFVSSQTSHGSTGAYSFTVSENPSNFMVYARKDGSPNVFDATDNNLTPS